MSVIRTEQRFSAVENVTATILGHPDVTVPCQILNFSKSGMCISVAEAISEGKIVKVEWSDNFLVGRARHATSEAGGVQVGIELLYCSQWRGAVREILAEAEAEVCVPSGGLSAPPKKRVPGKGSRVETNLVRS
jgi:hypothetical protein